MESTAQAITTQAMIVQYPNLLLTLAVIGALALAEHIFMAGHWWGKRGKK